MTQCIRGWICPGTGAEALVDNGVCSDPSAEEIESDDRVSEDFELMQVWHDGSRS